MDALQLRKRLKTLDTSIGKLVTEKRAIEQQLFDIVNSCDHSNEARRYVAKDDNFIRTCPDCGRSRVTVA